MFGSVSKTLLAVGFAATVLASKKAPALKPLTKDERDLALADLPGIKFDHLASSRPPTNRKTKSRAKTTKNVSRIHGHRGLKSGSRSAANVLGSLQRKFGGTGYENITSATAFGTQYAISVTLEDQDFWLILDTGSSDTWVVQNGFNCTDWYGDSLEPGVCGFGSTYKGEYTYGEIPDEHFYIQYGDGEVISGPLGYMDVSIAGIDVTNQTIALANETYWYGNNMTSGIIGLAYPALTNAYYGPEDLHNPYYQMQYSPIFSTMVQEGLIENVFSIAISRNSSGGEIAFGGIPYYLEGLDYWTYAETDIIIVGDFDTIESTSNILLTIIYPSRPISSTTPGLLTTTPSTPSFPMVGILVPPPIPERCHTLSTAVPP